MDEKAETLLRSIVASQSAHDFVLTHLLTQALLNVPGAKRRLVVDALLSRSILTDQFHGVSKDDFQAERLADMVIQAQQKIERLVRRALEGADMAEGRPVRSQ